MVPEEPEGGDGGSGAAGEGNDDLGYGNPIGFLYDYLPIDKDFDMTFPVYGCGGVVAILIIAFNLCAFGPKCCKKKKGEADQ